MRDHEQVAEAVFLVVDDEPANTALVERILRREGYSNINCINDSREALSTYRESNPDMVLLDMLMPHMDGFAVLEELGREIPGDEFVPIVVLTADTNEETRKRALWMGATDFLTKPFDHIEVVFRIRNLLETRALHVSLREHNRRLDAAVADRTTELRESLELLRRSDKQRRALMAHLVEAQEEERQRIAADVHDDSVQVMAAVAMRLEMLRSRISDPDDIEALKELEKTTHDAVSRLRYLLFELRPPSLDSDGLAAAIREYLQKASTDPASGSGFSFDVESEMRSEPPPEIRTTLYRIVQEALNNVRKHARADQVKVVLDERDGGFLARVSDDGRGFEMNHQGSRVPGHIGLSAMVERAEMAGGWCHLASSPGSGTTVEAWVPASLQKRDRTQDPAGVGT
ncbi:MAG: response regulator [Actinomycetota bacterium]